MISLFFLIKKVLKQSYKLKRGEIYIFFVGCVAWFGNGSGAVREQGLERAERPQWVILK